MKISSRRDQIRRATKHAYRAAHARRRPKIFQVPAVASVAQPTRGESMRPILIPAPVARSGWAQARARGRARGRVLDQKPKWPTRPEDRIIRASSARAKHPQRDKLRGFGMWWSGKLDAAIERRAVRTRPAYSKRQPSKGLIKRAREGTI